MGGWGLDAATVAVRLCAGVTIGIVVARSRAAQAAAAKGHPQDFSRDGGYTSEKERFSSSFCSV